MSIAITTLPGDGIGPEIMSATQKILLATGAPLSFEACEAGALSFARGIDSGVPVETIASILKNKIVLKAPLETPIGYGGKSANVTLRKLCNTYGNIRPTQSIPGIKTPFSDRAISFTVIRENIEDLYAGIEYRQTPSVTQGLKIISQSGCERIIRLAFERARLEGRRSVHCISKANIMKMTEGLMKSTFERIAPEYSDIQALHMLVDNCAHQMVRRPESFEILVCTNLHGDILSDLAAGLVGGLGLAPSMNVGPEIAFFEAVHGSAPDIAGQNKANPTALLLSGAFLLEHLSLPDHAQALRQALFSVLKNEQCRTADLMTPGARLLSLSEFTDAVLQALSALSIPPARDTVPDKPIEKPVSAPVVDKTKPRLSVAQTPLVPVGLDVFIQSTESAVRLGQAVEKIVNSTPFTLKNIANRGTQVYPVLGETAVDCVDCYALRLFLKGEEKWDESAVFALLKTLGQHYFWTHIEKLWRQDDKGNYSLAQGESQ